MIPVKSLRLTAISLPIALTALAATGSSAEPWPTGCAGNATGTSSCNTLIRNIPLPSFNEQDIGLIVDLVYNVCNNSPVTSIANGPYRRVSNAPGPVKQQGQAVISTGDARHDMAVIDVSNGLSGSNSFTVSLTAAQIEAQIGVNFGVSLSAVISPGPDNTLTITDTTGFLGVAAQLVDAGGAQANPPSPPVGGFEAAVMIKNGTPKTAAVLCDQNMWYSQNGSLNYGFTGLPLLEPVNRLLLFWVMGPSAAGSANAITNMCNALNASGAVPKRDYDLSPPPYITAPPGVTGDPVSSYQTGNAYLREIETVAVSAGAVRVYGDPALPAEYSSCRQPATYCDITEPVPASGVSGNSCNPESGTSSPPSINAELLNAGNASYCKLTSIGTQMCFQY